MKGQKARGRKKKARDGPSLNPQAGMRARQLRKGKQLTQRALADLAGVNVDAVVRMENGHDVLLSTVERIVQALGTTVHALYAPIG